VNKLDESKIDDLLNAARAKRISAREAAFAIVNIIAGRWEAGEKEKDHADHHR
jgi:hypothetical protein